MLNLAQKENQMSLDEEALIAFNLIQNAEKTNLENLEKKLTEPKDFLGRLSGRIRYFFGRSVVKYSLIGVLALGGSCLGFGIGCSGNKPSQAKQNKEVMEEILDTYQEEEYIKNNQKVFCYLDQDNDGFPSKNSYLDENKKPISTEFDNPQCPSGTAAPKGIYDFDCNDKAPTIYPGAPEICDNLDNDCDGETDENLTKSCYSPCGEGVITCSDGKWSDCTAYPSQIEICDGKDNDCNGKTDEGLTKPCSTPCGKGVLICSNGKWSACTAPPVLEEICNCKDDDCNGKVDDIAGCCVADDTKNQKYCPTGELKEQDVCVNCSEWVHEVILEKCPCSDYKWICLDKKIGKICAEGNINTNFDTFFAQEPQDKNQNEACISQWCCKNDKGNDWGCEHGQDYLKKTCYCITQFGGYDERGDSFYSQKQECPQHEYCDQDTNISIIVNNRKTLDLYVWINWHSYGTPPQGKIIEPDETYVIRIDESMLPKSGTEIQLCTSSFGCSQKIPIYCGNNKIFTIDWMFKSDVEMEKRMEEGR